MRRRNLLFSYLATYAAIVLVRRFALDHGWSGALFGRLPVLYLAIALTSLVLVPFLTRTPPRQR